MAGPGVVRYGTAMCGLVVLVYARYVEAGQVLLEYGNHRRDRHGSGFDAARWDATRSCELRTGDASQVGFGHVMGPTGA